MKKLAAVLCAMGVLFMAGCTSSCCGPEPCCNPSPCCAAPAPCCPAPTPCCSYKGECCH